MLESLTSMNGVWWQYLHTQLKLAGIKKSRIRASMLLGCSFRASSSFRWAEWRSWREVSLCGEEKSQRAAFPSIQLLWRFQNEGVLVCRKYQSTSHMFGCSNKPEEGSIQQEQEVWTVWYSMWTITTLIIWIIIQWETKTKISCCFNWVSNFIWDIKTVQHQFIHLFVWHKTTK